MKTSNKSLILLSLAFVALSCGPGTKKEGEQATIVSKKYTVYKAPDAVAYPDATLTLESPESVSETDSAIFKFGVTNYELAIATPDAETRGIANSHHGQHIHFILDNGPYSAHYDAEFKKKFAPGKHTVLAFLSRSYHESVKNSTSFILKEYQVGEDDGSPAFDMSAQHLFYSRPKGTYSGADTEKLLLDFFLINNTLSPDGNKVRATINGEEHMLTEWAPYFIEGLEKGEVTIQLDLLDKDGNLIPGPYNSVSRKVTLE